MNGAGQSTRAWLASVRIGRQGMALSIGRIDVAFGGASSLMAAFLIAVMAQYGCADASHDSDQSEAELPRGGHAVSDNNLGDGAAGNDAGSNTDGADIPLPEGPAIEDAAYTPFSIRASRLTQAQVINSIQTVFGREITVPPSADPDLKEGNFLAVGATISTPSTRGVESIESLSFAVAAEVVSAEHRDRTIGCRPSRDDCVRGFIHQSARRLWRRSVTETESQRLLEVFETVSNRLDDPYAGLEFVLAAILQSPHFIYRNEPTIDGRYTDHALASKLSYLLWNTTPDEALLDAADAGLLSTDTGLRAHIERLLKSPQSEPAILRFFEEWFGLEKLDALNKDPTVFRAMSSDLGPSARTETLMNLAEIIFENDSDLRALLVRRRTYVNRKLAAMYEIPAPTREGFGAVQLPETHRRRGLLGQISFLALHAHPVSTSATLRGMFVREGLLCQAVPPPPADVDTSIPEPSGRRQTLRQRVDEHLTSNRCQGCHLLTDPIGLAFETFDGIGVARSVDNGGEIDPSGDLDGQVFDDAYELAGYLRDHPAFPRCVVRNLHRFVTGQIETENQTAMLAALTRRFAELDYRFKPLMVEFLMSPVFREAESALRDTP
ncbi:MAG: DUF1592 domain-containing protein [Myxococcota bacterium]|nr:DUF1592 domain-containing protein [Myxococcota bacterium]